MLNKYILKRILANNLYAKILFQKYSFNLRGIQTVNWGFKKVFLTIIYVTHVCYY